MGEKSEKPLNVNDIMESIKQLHNEFIRKNDEIINKIKDTDDNINKFMEKLQLNTDKITDLEKRFKSYEDGYRRKNLLLFNFPEKNNEKIYDLEKEIESIFQDVLKISINLKDIDFIKRIGKNQGKRPVLIRFLALRSKFTVLRSVNNLKGTNLVISEDFPVDVREERKKLYPFWKAARKQNKPAYMKYNKLVIDGKMLNLNELINKDEEGVNYTSESDVAEDSASTGLENLSDGTLRNWLTEGKLVRRKIKPKKRKAEGSPGKRLFFRRTQEPKEPVPPRGTELAKRE